MIDVIGILGNDLTVVNAARVSFNKEVSQFENKDYRLIKFLLKHNHWTPFSHPQLTLRIKMPIFIARQWFKHMIGFSRNEVSRRYVDSEPEFFIPEYLRSKAADKKQGSLLEENPQSQQLLKLLGDTYKRTQSCYENMLACGVCAEQARMVLPQAMYTEFYETASLAGYLRLVGLRKSPDAQKEIQDYAEKIYLILLGAFSQTMKAVNELYNDLSV